MVTRFISDLHLSESRPDITERFLQFMGGEARNSEALYILGDLFDYWIGDDDRSAFHNTVEQAIRDLTDHGIPVYFIAGNRDFLIGKSFAKRTGIQLLSEPSVIDLYGHNAVVMHGDTLCTKDKNYLRFRRIIRNPFLLSILRILPLSLRRKIAQNLRDNSATNQEVTPQMLDIMDATETGVQQTMLQCKASNLLIHGHTHRPAIHQHQIDNRQITRIVLGDWFEQGSILNVTADGYDLKSF